MSIRCGSCRHVVLASAAESVFFYVKDPTQVHIAVKPERLPLVRRSPEADVRFVPNDDPSRRKKASEKVRCGRCGVAIGAVCPVGPGGCDVATFGRDRVEVCGVPPTKKGKSKKAPKFGAVYDSVSEWRELERRVGEENFRPAVGRAEDARAATAASLEPLIPSDPLVLPHFSSAWMGEVDGSKLDEIDSFFGWDHEQLPPGSNRPRPYQIQAIVEGLLRDLIVVLPTGAGKTLVAAHVIFRLKIRNPEYMAAFVVDRIPLVFQQGCALERDTGLRVCCLCGENINTMSVRELNEGHFDILVITAGCLLSVLDKKWLDLAKQFCCIVFDECHHASGNHVYGKVLDHLKRGFHSTPPRLIGLTASPISSRTTNTASIRLHELCERFGRNTGVLYPEVPPTQTRVRWHVVSRYQSQEAFARRVIQGLKPFANELNRLLAIHGGSWDMDSEQHSLITLERCDDADLDHFLNPATVGRLRGQLSSASWRVTTSTTASDEQHEQMRFQVSFLVDVMKALLAALEASEVMGSTFGESVVVELCLWMDDRIKNTEGYATSTPALFDTIEKLRCDFPSKTQNSGAQVLSDRLHQLKAELSTRLHATDTRILILVHTREVAHQLTRLLQSDESINRSFRPRLVVGHGGYDGMNWHNDQSAALDAFRRGVQPIDVEDDYDLPMGCRLLVATSVLEEGLDVEQCDLVVRLQGVQSLIGFIQSRGRARKQNSEMLVLASAREQQHLENVRHQEGKMKLVVQRHANMMGIPSHGSRRIQDLLSQRYALEENNAAEGPSSNNSSGGSGVGARPPNSAHLGSSQEAVVRLIVPCKSHIDEEQLENHITSVFAGYEENALTLSRIVRLDGTGIASQIFDEHACQSFLVGWSLISQTEDGNGTWRLFEQTCLEWDFQLSSTAKPCWIHRYGGPDEATRGKDAITFINQAGTTAQVKCSLGVWGGANTFIKRHEIPTSEVASVCFKRKEGLVIQCQENIQILVPQAIIAHFCLINCCNERRVKLFVPLSSAVSVIETLQIGDKGLIIRLTDSDQYPHLRALSTLPVLCLSISQSESFDNGSSLIESLLELEKEFLAVPIFETRVSVTDETTLVRLVDWQRVQHRLGGGQLARLQPYDSSLPLIRNEFAFVASGSSPALVIDPHSRYLPSCNTSQSEVRDAHWILLSAFSQRLGCFTDGIREYIWNFTTRIVDNLLAALNRSALGLQDDLSSLLYALQQCFGVPYWAADLKGRFDSAFESMCRLEREGWHPADTAAIAEETMGASNYSSCRDKGNWFKVYRAVQTPTRVVYHPPVLVKGSRLYRNFGSERFVTVSFRDEQMQQLHGEEIIGSVRRRISHGMTFAGRETVFFGGSSSQLRQQQLLFVDIESLPHCDAFNDTNIRLKSLREQILCPSWVQSIANVSSDKCGGAPKFLSRLALFCTADTPTEIIEDIDANVLRVDDIEVHNSQSDVFGTALTDGTGCIALSLARRVAEEFLKITFVPSALQIRYLGAKGVLLVLPDEHPRLKGKLILLRPSMEKFSMGSVQDHSLCVVDYSRYRPMFMNRQIITLLTSPVSGDSEVFHADGRRFAPLEALQEHLTKALCVEATVFTDADKAADLLTARGTSADHIVRAFRKLQPHMDVLSETFCVDILRANYRFAIRSLVNKTRIPVKKGCQLMGVADEFGVLKDGEVFVQIDCHVDGHPFVLTQADVAIWRNPALHPGDLRIVTAVDRPELRDFVNVIVFPAARPGIKRNLPLECSGGDLDGDLYYILWNEELVPPRHTQVAPLPYHKFAEHMVEGEDEDAEAAGFGVDFHFMREMMRGTIGCGDERFTNQMLSPFIAMVFAADLLGPIASMHLALSDLLQAGARDPLACEVAKAQSYAVDFPKTGVPPRVPLAAVKKIAREGFPDFMDKRDKANYTSSKPLGFLYRRAASFDFNYTSVAQHASMSPNSKQGQHYAVIDVRITSLAKHASEAQHAEAKLLYEKYWSSLRGVMISYGLKSDAECMLAQSSHFHPMIHDYGKAQDTIRLKVAALFRDLQDFFVRRYGSKSQHEKWIVACLWYEVAHRDGRARSFSFILADLLSEYLESSVDERNICKSSSEGCYERIGKPLLRYCEKAQSQMHENRSAKLAICQTLEHALEQYGLCRESFRICPFGSVAHGLCEVNSDLDVYVDFGLSAPDQESRHHRHPSQLTSVLGALGFSTQDDFFRGSSKSEREKQQLVMILSPAFEPISRHKEEILDARVPIIRCHIPFSLADAHADSAEASTAQQVDVSCCPTGAWKACWMQAMFRYDPSLYCAFIVLIRWGRAANLISKKGQNSSRVAGNHSSALFATGDFHALIFYVLRNNIELDVPVPTTSLADRTDGDYAKDLMIASASPSRVGRLVLSFFERVQELTGKLVNSGEEHMEFVWPLEKIHGSSHEIAPDTLTLMTARLETSRLQSLHQFCDPARHCLLSCADPQQLLELAAGDARVVRFSQKLSLALSYRIGHALEFHACRLSLLSGCPKVELQPVSARHNSQLMISAEASNRCIRRLKEALSNSSKAASAGSWNCRAVTRASRYFMESSSDIHALGCSLAGVQVKFPQLLAKRHGNKKDAIAEFLSRHSLDEYSLCRTVPTSSDEEARNPFSIPLNNNWQQVLDPKDLALVRSLSLHLMRQLPHSTTFETAVLSIVFGHFVVVNVSRRYQQARKR